MQTRVHQRRCEGFALTSLQSRTPLKQLMEATWRFILQDDSVLDFIVCLLISQHSGFLRQTLKKPILKPLEMPKICGCLGNEPCTKQTTNKTPAKTCKNSRKQPSKSAPTTSQNPRQKVGKSRSTNPKPLAERVD